MNPLLAALVARLGYRWNTICAPEHVHMPHSTFIFCGATDDAVFIRDADEGSLSVTNDAERVCQVIMRDCGNVRIFYRDSMRQWGEMIHDHGTFKGFRCMEAPMLGGVVRPK